MQVSFDTTREEMGLIQQIVKRAIKLNPSFKGVDLDMDITATHANGCPLDLKKLLKADDFNFIHDVYGIAKHLDRETGTLTKSFLPRCYNSGKKK